MQRTSNSGVSVYLVEDSAPLRARLVEIVQTSDACVVGEAETADEAIAGITLAHPDVVLLDLHLRRGGGLDVLRALTGSPAAPAFIVLTNDPNDGYRDACMAAGAQAFLDKSRDFLRINEIIGSIASHTPSQ
jgi:DNA-binding NarL/FixJ family response regulator